MIKLELNALSRDTKGTDASRRLRREQEMVPGVIYGGGETNELVMFHSKDVVRLLKQETAYSHRITITSAGGAEVAAILREVQRHPVRGDAIHLDFMRIDENREVKVKIPLHIINADKCPGVKMQGGSVSHSMAEVEVSCLPSLIPDFLEVDVLHLDVRDALHLSDLTMPEGVSLVALLHGDAHDLPIASVRPPRGGADEEDELEGEGEAPVAEEVAAIKQKTDEDGEVEADRG